MEPIASPEINGYRTKCEFSIGTNLNDERSVGFLLGMYKEGQTRVQSPAELSNIPDVAKKIANGMEVSTGYRRRKMIAAILPLDLTSLSPSFRNIFVSQNILLMIESAMKAFGVVCWLEAQRPEKVGTRIAYIIFFHVYTLALTSL